MCYKDATGVSARPNEHNRQQCTNCGKPREEEAYFPPAVMKKGGELFLVDPGRLIKDQGEQALANSGETHNCPFCNTSGFKIEVQCKGCGAEVENKSEVSALALSRARNQQKPGSQNTRSQQEASDTRSEAHSEPQMRADTHTATKTTSTNSPRFRNRIIGSFVGATMFVSTTIGAVWGQQTYTETGIVQNVSHTEVSVSYGQGSTIKLKRPDTDRVQWRLGEEVELYFVKWRMGQASAGERMNGDILLPLKQ